MMTENWKTAVIGGAAGAMVALVFAFGAASLDLPPFMTANANAMHAYLVSHPEVLVEMSNRLQAKQDDEQDTSRQAAVDKLTAFWRTCGSHVEVMDAQHHDLVLAITSHVPHLIAYNIVNTARHLERVTDTEVIKFSAGGFRDFTRIAASDPVMWRDVFLNNKEAVLEMLGRFSEDLSTLTRAIRRGDGDTLFEHFTRTRAIRRGIVEIGQDSPAPDFGRPHPGLPHEPLPRPYAAEE